MANVTIQESHGFTTIQMVLEKTTEPRFMDRLEGALCEAARLYVEQNMDKITAKLDIAGLGNLIAIYAAKKLGESMK